MLKETIKFEINLAPLDELSEQWRKNPKRLTDVQIEIICEDLRRRLVAARRKLGSSFVYLNHGPLYESEQGF